LRGSIDAALGQTPRQLIVYTGGAGETNAFPERHGKLFSLPWQNGEKAGLISTPRLSREDDGYG